MAEHVAPIGDQFVYSADDGLEGRYGYSLEGTFLAQYIQYGRGIGSEFVVPEQIDDVVEVTRSRALSERADFFTEDLFVGITPSRNTPFGQVAIGMSDGSIDGRKYQHFIDGQVKLDTRYAAGALERTFIIQTPFATEAAA